jgi:flagellar biosynthesis protein FlhB
VSDDADRESKTESPTERRIHDALERGNTPFSRETVTFGSLLAILAAIMLNANHTLPEILRELSVLLGNVDQYQLSNGADGPKLFSFVLHTVFTLIFPVVLIIAAGGVLGSLGQNVPNATFERVAPKINRLSPASNASRMFGKQGQFEFLKSLIKLFAVALVVRHSLLANLPKINGAIDGDIGRLPTRLLDVVCAVAGQICILSFLIALIDVVTTRMKWHGDLKMTRQEVKDEHKQSEGDPHLKERIKTIGRQRAKNRMMLDLPKATLVLVNPTHYAVALRYVPAEGGAPLVIAKGLDLLALKIRSECESTGIPVIENKPLAQSLHRTCDVGNMIPAEHYRAVAEVIHYVESRKRSFRRNHIQA